MSTTTRVSLPATHRAGELRTRPVLRGVAASALLVTAAVHVPVAIQHLRETPYLGLAFCGFVVAAAGAAGSLLVSGGPRLWAGLVGLNVTAIALFVVSRAVGLPGAADDRGDWTGRAGLTAVAAELVVVAASLFALRDPGAELP